MPYPPNLCASVPICGRCFSARMFCVFRVFCGNSLPVCLFMSVVVFSHGFHGFPQNVRLRYWRRGYGRMPYPPNLCASVSICGRLSLPEGSVCSAYSVGHSLPVCLVGALETSAPPLEVALTALLVHLWAAHLRRIPSAARSDSVRHPIRLRPPSNQIAFAIRSDSVRCTMP